MWEARESLLMLLLLIPTLEVKTNLEVVLASMPYWQMGSLIMKKLRGLSKRWFCHKQIVTTSSHQEDIFELITQDLVTIIHLSIFPTSHVLDITKSRSLIIFCILTSRTWILGKQIAYETLHCANMLGTIGLGHPSLKIIYVD